MVVLVDLLRPHHLSPSPISSTRPLTATNIWNLPVRLAVNVPLGIRTSVTGSALLSLRAPHRITSCPSPPNSAPSYSHQTMPRPNLPPTPGSSTDIKGRDGTHSLKTLHMSFELPPPAMHDVARVSPDDGKQQPSPTSPAHSTSTSQAYPMQAAETVKARRRSSAAQQGGVKESGFALPPPPTRSRKIIHMKPPSEEPADAGPSQASASKAKGGKAAAPSAKASTKENTVGPGAGAQSGGKKKQPSATSAAGRKIARKTAHSLIERRRRSKMNEEFGVLKGLIPACTGDMHKLAILQVGSPLQQSPNTVH